MNMKDKFIEVSVVTKSGWQTKTLLNIDKILSVRDHEHDKLMLTFVCDSDPMIVSGFSLKGFSNLLNSTATKINLTT